MSLLKEKNFQTRATTGVFFVGAIIACIFSHQYAFYALVFFIHVLCLKEFYDLVIEKEQRFFKNYAMGVATLLAVSYTVIYTGSDSLSLAWEELNFDILIYLLLFSIVFIQLYYVSTKPFNNIAFAYFGIFYISLPLVLLLIIAFNYFGEYNAPFIMLLFLLVWTNDTGAYLTGKVFGKRKLFERISPKKTWEGTFGGLALSIIIAALYGEFVLDMSPIMLGGLGLVIAVFSTLGDLIESQLKRSLDIKDSGTLLPGHGGFLDRFDGFLVAIPAAFFYLYLVNIV